MSELANEIREKLKRQLGGLDIFCIVAGTMISSGLFVLPSMAYAKVGPAVFVSYLLAALFVIPGLLSKAELSSAMPKAGGTYFYLDRSLGHVAGCYGGLTDWIAISLKSAFALTGMAIFLTLAFPKMDSFHLKLCAIGFATVFIAFNVLSVKFASRFLMLFVLAKVLLLIAYIAVCCPKISLQSFEPFAPAGFAAILAMAGHVFISYGGVTEVTSMAEEVDNPGRNILVGLFTGFIVTSVIYVLAVFATVGVLGGALAGAAAPLSAGASAAIGGVGLAVMSAAAFISFMTTANAGILSGSRYPMAMSRDGLMPSFICSISARFATPYAAVLLTGGIIIATIAFLDVHDLVDTASTFTIMVFMFDNLAVITMRESRIVAYRPKFKAPFYPWLQMAGVAGYLFLLTLMGHMALFITACFAVAATLWYFAYIRRRCDKGSAIVHVIERLVPSVIAGNKLNEELRDILQERDNIVEDRFDRLIKSCLIIDYVPSDPSKASVEDALRIAAPGLAARLEAKPEAVLESLMERERRYSSCISDELAIPHFIAEGSGKFEIAILRSKASLAPVLPQGPSPSSLFIMAASADERSFHLRALSAIAQISQDSHFIRHWRIARNEEDLRSLILLAERRRVDYL